MTGTQHQVLVGLMVSGPFTFYPQYRADTLVFYRAMAADGLVTETDAGEGRFLFTITPKGRTMAAEETRRLRVRLSRSWQ